MPDFARARISDAATELGEYEAFLKTLGAGDVVTLPLHEEESTRRVMRALNAAAAQSQMRLVRLSSLDDAVRFRVAAGRKRRLNLSPEAIKARTEKARATRAATRRQAK